MTAHLRGQAVSGPLDALGPLRPPHPLDALHPSAAGPLSYDDGLVRVTRYDRYDRYDRGGRDDPIVCTEHFRLHRRGRAVEVSHRLPPDRLDNDLAGLLLDELFTPGWLSGADVFERVFVGIVRTAGPCGGADPLAAWTAFYANTLARIRQEWTAPGAGGRGGCDRHGRSLIAGMAPVYERALRLVPAGPVLDLGSCFGFFPLLLAERPGNPVIASDLVPGSMRLLAAVAAARRQRLDTLACDAAAVPLPDGAVRTVTLIHLLEHLDPAQGAAVLAEALRLATGRVIVAVPFEDEPTAVYGHLRSFDAASLTELGAATGLPFTVGVHHGGWLVFTRDDQIRPILLAS